MRTAAFASRNTKEILRDPLTLFFGVGFPLVLMVLLSAINAGIPQQAAMTMFHIEKLAPGISVFGLSFLSLFSSMLIAKDRSTSFMLRLFTSPIKPAEFIIGYLTPIIPMAMAQSAICYLFALIYGLGFSVNLLAAVIVNLPVALFFIALGLLLGSVLNEKAVGGICGALVTNLSAWFSNIWFDTSMVGGAFSKIADVLPFSHAVAAARAAASGDFGAIFPDLWWVIGYAAVCLAAAITVFSVKLKKN